MSRMRLATTGFTLLEVVLAMFIFAVILGLALIFGAYFSKSYDFSFEENIAVGEAERSVRVMSQELREARDGEDGSYPLATANDQELVFYSDVDNDGQTERVRYYLVANQLVRQVFNVVSDSSTYSCVGECVICHNPGPSEETITIPESAWPAHYAHGDYIGSCGTGGGGGGGEEPEASERVVADYINSGASPLFYYYNGDWPLDTLNNPLPVSDRLLETKMIEVEVVVNVDPDTIPDDFTLSSFTHLRNLKTNL